MNYQRINNLLGWISFLIAASVYTLTLEPTVSFWDCGEFISAAFKLQIVHQPGAPLFLMIGKMFSLLAGNNLSRVAFWVNMSSALASAATILFLFWTITALAKKIILQAGETANTGQLITIMGSGLVGALAYTFSDSFWFSAVEAEVYALSSLCTAVVFWAILKWDGHADEPHADKWLVFIAYVMGLSIGVHLLNLLAIPAIALVYYFRRSKKRTSGGAILALFVGIVILAFIQYGIVQYLVKFAAYSDLFFVNTLGLGFGSGVTFFVALLLLTLTFGILYTIRGSKTSLLITVVSFVALMTIGGGFGGLIVAAILLAVLEYLVKIRNKRRVLNLALISITFIILGYGSYAMIVIRAKADPTLNNSDPDNAFALLSYVNREQYGDRPLLYGQYFDSKPVDSKEGDYIYRKGDKKYEQAGRKFERVYDRNTLLPRMYSDDPQHVSYYRDWMGMTETQSPTFLDNIGFLISYQTSFMYSRYFAWNFIGRQNDEQGHGDFIHGNWLSGIKFIDNMLVGGQNDLPQSELQNKAFNRFYFLPFILGIIGAVWHFRKNQKDAGIVALLFFFTGLAIVLYLNQNPLQPRERDYAFTGSFYAFAIWIGLGVAGISSFLRRKISARFAALTATLIGLLAAPVLMAEEGWDDHDRSEKFTAHDFAVDYLESCAPNAILFTYGDNDTYPLWYVQEVENVRPDVRVVNLSLLGTDWYIRQMKKKVNQAPPLPISMEDSKFVQGLRDVIYYDPNYYQVEGSAELKDVFDVLVSDNPNDKAPSQYQEGVKENFLPTKKLKITASPAEVLSTNTVPASKKDQIVPALEWQYNKNYVTKTELAIFDILAHNQWKRPIYFAITVPSDNYIGLDNYLYNEGFAYRLLPLQKAAVDSVEEQKPELVNTDAMYDHMMNKFKWGNMKNANYLDPESVRMVAVVVNNFNILAETLYKEGRIEEAKKALDKCLSVIPDQNYSLNFTIRKFYMASLLYKLKEAQKANQVVQNTADYITGQLNYLYAISQTKENLGAQEIQLGMSVLNELVKVTAENGQTALNKNIESKYKALESKFIGQR
jgi:tetratricopeptide (TPR) repeat protein